MVLVERVPDSGFDSISPDPFKTSNREKNSLEETVAPRRPLTRGAPPDAYEVRQGSLDRPRFLAIMENSHGKAPSQSSNQNWGLEIDLSGND